MTFCRPFSPRNAKTARGASLLEALVVLATLGALVRMGIPNWYEFRARASDIQGVKFYRDLKDELLRLDQEENPQPVAAFNQTKPGRLGTLRNISIPTGIRLHYAIYLPRSEWQDSENSVIAFEVSHEKGNIAFRYLRVGDELLEQQISKDDL